MNNVLEISNLNKSYYSLSGKINVLNNINFNIKDGEIIAIVGSSGCGKSTLLNILADIDKEYTGKILKKGSTGYMLQQDALLPWLSVYENIMLPKKFKYNIDEKYVIKMLGKYNLLDFKDKLPNSLSGGMKQRVAFIRTLVTKPKILLLDEPFSALDYQTRLILENDIYDLIKKEKITTVIVTHDISEACALADRIVVLTKRPGSIKNIYDIKLKNKSNPLNNRTDEKFNYYFNLIWKELDENVT